MHTEKIIVTLPSPLLRFVQEYQQSHDSNQTVGMNLEEAARRVLESEKDATGIIHSERST